MATRNDLKRSYSRMTEATEATRRAVDRVDESVKANTRATQLGNVITGFAAYRAEVNARKTHRRLDAVGEKIDEMNEAVTSKLDKIDGGIKSLTDEVRLVHDQTEDLKNISFAQWRDGAGQTYWREYRPLGRKLLEDYDQLSLAWRQVVAKRVSHVIDDYGNWKDDEWRSNSILDGQFYPYPDLPEEPRRVALPSGNLKKSPLKPYITFVTIVIAIGLFLFGTLGVSIVYGSGGTLFEEYRAAQQIEEYKDDENPAMYAFLKYVEQPYSCPIDNGTEEIPIDNITKDIEMIRDQFPSGSAKHQAWDRASSASLEQIIEACRFSQKMGGVNADGSVDAVDGFGRGQAEENTPKLMLLFGFGLPALYFVFLWARNKKRAKDNRAIDEMMDSHRKEVQAAHDEWVSQRDRIAEHWAARNTAAGKEMQRRFISHVGVPITGERAPEYWAAPMTRNEAHAWARILEKERVNPPDVTELKTPSRIELNPKMPDWHRSHFESAYRKIVPREL